MNRFDPGTDTWCERLGLLRDQVRQRLVAEQIAQNIAELKPRERLSILDVGCGQGDQAIGLAREGHEVVAVDSSPTMLIAGRNAAATEPSEVLARLQFVEGNLLDLPSDLAGNFDLVCCHGVVMYLDDLDHAVQCLAATLQPGGIVSLLTRNRFGIAMRAGMIRDWSAAVSGFDSRHYTNRLDIERVRGDEPAEVQDAFRRAGVATAAWYGVRLFSDHHGNAEAGVDFEELLAAEREAGSRDPYRQLAALTHTIGVLGG